MVKQAEAQKIRLGQDFISWANATCVTCGEVFIEETDEEVLHFLRMHTCAP